MKKTKEIKVSVNLCDVCGKETSRPNFRGDRHFCNEHKYIQDAMELLWEGTRKEMKDVDFFLGKGVYDDLLSVFRDYYAKN